VRRRVVITGMGAVCSAGGSSLTLCETVLRGAPAFSAIGRPHLAHFRATHAGIIKDFDEAKIIADPCVLSLDRFVGFAAVAAGEAIAQAGIVPKRYLRRMGLLFATCSGPMQTIERHYADIFSGDVAITREELFATRYYCGAKALAHVFGIGGLSTTVVTACSASTAALGFAADLIRLGVLDVVLAGGSDTFSETTLAGFDGLKATCEGPCAPFSKPVGLNLGEGAAFCVLESQAHAASRGAAVLAEIAGFGLSNDAYHCTSPDPSGAGQSLAMERALRDAGVSPASIIYINAHGTGTEANDKAETKAIRKVFGSGAQTVPVSSTKSMIGHCLGAAGALESVVSIMCLSRGFIPPTANFSGQRDGCVLDYVPETGRTLAGSGGPMLKNSFAFGGNNASIVLNTFPEPEEPFINNAATGAIVITGIGLVSPAGIGTKKFLQAIKSGTGCFTSEQVPGRAPVLAGKVPAFDMTAVDRRLDTRNMDRSSLFATAAARLAMQDYSQSGKQPGRGELGLFLHLSAGPSWAESEHIGSLLRGGFRINQVAAFPYIVPNSVAGNVCRALRITGHNTTLSSGPGAGLMGLGISAIALKNEHVKALISVSADELSDHLLTDLIAVGLASEHGVSYSEGACAFMLETEAHAKSHNAAVLGRVCSVAYSTETEDCIWTDSGTSVLEETCRDALGQAGIGGDEIGLLCCNAGNPREIAALDAVVGRREGFMVDCSGVVGYAEASAQLFSLSQALLDSSLKTWHDKKYIFTVFSSPHGVNCAIVLQKCDVKEPNK
jgi:3-oxoacyl-[acyl-carrier-protein] synthase II